MVEFVNYALAVLSIAFGGIGLISPTYAMEALRLRTDGCNDGLSELRAASGGAFVALAIAAIALSMVGQPLGWVLMGVHYAGAAVGRITSIVLDGAGSAKMWMFFAIEALFAVWLISANFPGAVLL